MAAMFAFLDGISPWWWVAFALVLGAVELMTFSYYLLWLCLAAVSVAATLVIAPGMGGIGQVAVFCLLAVLYTGLGWYFVQRHKTGQEPGALNNRASALIGRRAVVAGEFSGGLGPVEVDGIRWRGRVTGGAALKEGDELEVSGAEGILLELSPPT